MKELKFNISHVDRFLDKISTKTINFLPSLLLAIVIFILGKWLIKILMKLLKKSLNRYEVDPSLATFFRSIIKFVLNSLLIVSIIALLGFPTTSFIAVLSAAGLAIGLALQGSLANFAGGVLILFFKPFKIGDTIESNNCVGTVMRIDILHTTINTSDNKAIILPNGYLANNNIVNYTRESKRRIDFAIRISYQSDLAIVRKIIIDVLQQDDRIATTPAPIVVLNQLGDFGLNLIVRCWTDTLIASEVYWENLEKIKQTLDHNKIELVLPAREVLIKKT